MKTAAMFRPARGFTLIELVVTVTIVALLATVALPVAELAVKRDKEQDLRVALRQIRGALDDYKRAVEQGHILARVDGSGYPATLDELAAGVDDAQSPLARKIYFLRRLPRDPFFSDPAVPAAETWGKRSYASPPNAPTPGDDLFDVYSLASGTGINGIPYREW
ncbi:MAG: type II secretion system protein [Gallionellaceae bacterium]|nr:type II secretion system protein [Gallionellaceae bacterium]